MESCRAIGWRLSGSPGLDGWPTCCRLKRKMSDHYRHSQKGWFIVAALTAGIALMVFDLLAGGFRTGSFAGLLLLVTALLLFYRLHVTLEDDVLTIRFGIGIIKKRLRLDDVESVRTVKNPWYWGWGIRWIGKRAWLFNVSGLDAVELKMKSGRVYRIGADRPEALEAAVGRVLHAELEDS